jgi:hypothetical protein
MATLTDNTMTLINPGRLVDLVTSSPGAELQVDDDLVAGSVDAGVAQVQPGLGQFGQHHRQQGELVADLSRGEERPADARDGLWAANGVKYLTRTTVLVPCFHTEGQTAATAPS